MDGSSAAPSGIDFSEARLRFVLDAIPMSVGFIGLDRTYSFCNRYFCDWYGISQSEVVGLSTRILFSTDEQYEVLGKAAYPVIMSGGTYDAEHVLCKRDGSRYPARTIGKLFDPRNPARGTIWIVDDITDHKIAGYVVALAKLTAEMTG